MNDTTRNTTRHKGDVHVEQDDENEAQLLWLEHEGPREGEGLQKARQGAVKRDRDAELGAHGGQLAQQHLLDRSAPRPLLVLDSESATNK
jgi:hypothetical protein